MTKDQVRVLTNQAFDLFNAQDWDALIDMMAPNARFEIGTLEPVSGLERARSFLRFIERHFDVTYTAWDVLVDDRSSAIQAKVRVKYLRDLPSLSPARGQTTEMRVAIFAAFEDQKVTRVNFIYSFVDWLEILV